MRKKKPNEIKTEKYDFEFFNDLVEILVIFSRNEKPTDTVAFVWSHQYSESLCAINTVLNAFTKDLPSLARTAFLA